jgi:pSer/pThr/pTyr-binding forkhead associated (FHA) protein
MTEVVCSRCGHPNSEASNYCSSCGFDLRRSQQEPTSEHLAVIIDGTEAAADSRVIDSDARSSETELGARGTAVFVVRRGAKAGARYGVTKRFTTIGRHPDSDIFLDDVTVSRRHAEVHREGDAVLLNDVGSLNGTYLNRTRIDSESLRSGDEVQVGKFKLVFLADES